MSWCRLVTALVLVFLVTGGGTQLGCRDQHGYSVDWWVLYKPPKIRTTLDPFVDEGTGYLHYSSMLNMLSLSMWVLSDVSINDSLSAPGRTLQPIYDDPWRDSLIYVFYNDGLPNGTTKSSKGHTKGVVAFDGDRGFWMVHSVPHFPEPPWKAYSYPPRGKTYGQSFLCLTLPSSQLETLAQQLLYMEPVIYASQMNPYLQARYPEMARVIAGETRRVWSIAGFATPCGDIFYSFAKSRYFGDDLYSRFVAEKLNVSLDTETWMRAATPENRLPSYCTPNLQVRNVVQINVTAFSPRLRLVMLFSFGNNRDHSKWAISTRSKPWVCIGDINRMESQFRRGGGAVCHMNYSLWRMFAGMVSLVEPCN